jgi:hypothetical protein
MLRIGLLPLLETIEDACVTTSGDALAAGGVLAKQLGVN